MQIKLLEELSEEEQFQQQLDAYLSDPNHYSKETLEKIYQENNNDGWFFVDEYNNDNCHKFDTLDEVAEHYVSYGCGDIPFPEQDKRFYAVSKKIGLIVPGPCLNYLY